MGSVFYSKEPIVLVNRVGSDEPPKEVSIVDNVTFETEEPCEPSFAPNNMPSMSFEVPIQGVNKQLFHKEKLPRRAKKIAKKALHNLIVSICALMVHKKHVATYTTPFGNFRFKVTNKDLRNYLRRSKWPHL